MKGFDSSFVYYLWHMIIDALLGLYGELYYRFSVILRAHKDPSGSHGEESDSTRSEQE